MANFLSHNGLEFSVNQCTIFYTLPSKIFSLRKYKRSHLRIFNLKYILSLMTFRIILKFSVELILGKCFTLPFFILSSSTFFYFKHTFFPTSCCPLDVQVLLLLEQCFKSGLVSLVSTILTYEFDSTLVTKTLSF